MCGKRALPYTSFQSVVKQYHDALIATRHQEGTMHIYVHISLVVFYQ